MITNKMRYPNGRRAPRNHVASTQLTVIWAHEPGEKNELTYFWRNSDAHNDAGAPSSRRDISILMEHFERLTGIHGRSLKDELIERGYDISTFKFTIEKLKP